MLDLLDTEWFVWGIGLILSFQVLVVVLGEAIYRADRKGRALAGIYRALRNGVLPLLVFYIFLSKIVGLESDSATMRAMATLFWISVIYAVLLLVNVLLFAQAAPNTWRARAPKLFQDLVRVSLVVIGAAVVLSVVWRRDLGGLVAALGISSIVLGFALQETLGNLMAGIAVLFERPFTIGDWIRVGTTTGEVIQINWRSVHLRTIDRNLLVIPNSAIGREIFTNYSAPTRIQTLRVTFAFSLDVPPNRVKEMLLEAARSTPYIADDPEPRAHTVEFEEDRIRYQAVLCLENPRMYRKLIDAYTTSVWYAAQRAGLKLPLPAREILDHKIVDEVDTGAYTNAVAARLGNVAVFSGLNEEQLKTLAGHADTKWFCANERVLEEGQMSEAVYVIESGRAHVLQQGNTAEPSEVLQLGEGELFGESALSRGQPNAGSVVAITDLEVLMIPLADLETLLDSGPQFAHQFANLIGMRADAAKRAVGGSS